MELNILVNDVRIFFFHPLQFMAMQCFDPGVYRTPYKLNIVQYCRPTVESALRARLSAIKVELEFHVTFLHKEKF